MNRIRMAFLFSFLLQTGDAFTGLDLFFQAHPFATAFLAGGAQASVADFVAQSRERFLHRNDSHKQEPPPRTTRWQQQQAKESSSSTPLSVDRHRPPFQVVLGIPPTVITTPFSPRRNLSFLLYGGLYQGMANEWIFNTLLPSFLTHQVLQALVAVFFFGSLVSLPIAYSIKAMVVNGKLPFQGIPKYWHDVTTEGLLNKFWSVWVPVNIVNFLCVPRHYRVTVNSMVAFCWLMILSTISSQSEKKQQQQQLLLPSSLKAIPVVA